MLYDEPVLFDAIVKVIVDDVGEEDDNTGASGVFVALINWFDSALVPPQLCANIFTAVSTATPIPFTIKFNDELVEFEIKVENDAYGNSSIITFIPLNVPLIV